MRKYALEITVFLCGALGMLLELVAARVLSPYVGSSNLIWTTIIGVMLTSMSLGYWIGGKLADKRPQVEIVSNLILLGAIFTSLIPVMEIIVVKNFTLISNNLILIAFLAAAIVFGFPSFILATISPFVVKLRDKDKEYQEIGKVSGSTSSLSTIGSIVGTFLAGFVLIPNLGVRMIILCATIILILLSIGLYPNKDRKYYLYIVVLVVSLIGINFAGKILFEKENPDIIKDVDSEYSRIWVKEVETEEAVYKTLQVDAQLESYIDQSTGKMGATYLPYYDLFEYFIPDAKATLMIGGAAYTYPMHYLTKYSDKTIDVSEIDSKMTELAVEQFGLDLQNERLKVYHQDGRTFLNTSKNQYDCILIDAFKGANAPFELTTYEAMTNAKNLLKDEGVVITNIISSLEGKDSEFIQHEYATYNKVFNEVKVFQVRPREKTEIQNLILVGIKGKGEKKEKIEKEYEELLETEIKEFQTDKKVVTDHYAPIGS